MTSDSNFENFNWALMAFTIENEKMIVYHFCGYEKKPDDVGKAIENLWEELVYDNEFKLDPEICRKMKIGEATPEVLDHYNKVYKKLRKSNENKNKIMLVNSVSSVNPLIRIVDANTPKHIVEEQKRIDQYIIRCIMAEVEKVKNETILH